MPLKNLPELPIDEILPELLAALAANSAAVLVAEPGSGKTTIVPLVLLDQPWLAHRKIILLEPRRLAARAAATRMSALLGEPVGTTVGYRVRFDSRVSRATRIEVVTEGILIRMIQNDPELAGVGLVIFDEFHERSLQGDLALALCLDGRQLRDDLKILVMSATIAGGEISALLGGAPVITGRGRCFPVTVEYLERPTDDFIVPLAVRGIDKALVEQSGDVLVFLPGGGEIRAVQALYGNREHLTCLPLYGDLPLEKQNRVFAGIPGRRLILATPIAETSLTIEGITTVVDCGLVKTPRFDPASSLTRLETIPISKASAEQRTGRAGRLGPGHCYRLWTRSEHHSRPDFLPPEIIHADLAPLILELALWGVSDPGRLVWADPPRPGQISQARRLLQDLGALDGQGVITPLGRELAVFPLHPRLALMLIHGKKQGLCGTVCRLAAILNNRDPLKQEAGSRSADIEERLQLLTIMERDGGDAVRAKGGDPAACRQILREADQYLGLLGETAGKTEPLSEAGNLLASAYPDRIAHRKSGSAQHLLASGCGAILPAGDHLAGAELLVAAKLDGGKRQGRIFLAASLAMDDLRRDHPRLIRTQKTVRWDAEQGRVAAVTEELLGSLVLSRKKWSGATPEQIRQCLLTGIRQSGVTCLPWQEKSRELKARITTAHLWQPEIWPDLDDAALMQDLSWLEPYLVGARALNDLKKLDLVDILLARLSWQEQQELERIAPTHLTVPSGSRIRLRYQPGETPILPVRIQEMFGCAETPTVAGGTIPVLVHLLSPAQRPIQITSDVAAFWRSTYREVKKELAGRYPKHYWPENPLEAEATSRAKRRKK
ncbi:MAG: ATP-dependent helicase HrpB [Proteobacteria bacterium]|nr:ATP-dependent helicase HrpB [Pseudomonadota bacterium]MBU1736685.1 ATP-dependent helicase HrpB [Pseudomonadota bacterium]